ncbi:MAG: cysteine desulfurase family protein [Candidatus Thermoplasmatota archaeon]|nr:cysteine desulfurase family protein [Candidatus Thermoplasmatota archaeon]
MRRVNFDSNSSMPTRREVVEKMMPIFTEHFGNPSSIHDQGREPRSSMEEARKKIASLINASPEEIFFTSGATESINLALRGPLPFKDKERDRIIISQVDHDSVRATSSAMESVDLHRGILSIDANGTIEIDKAADIIDGSVFLVSFPFASFEVGTIQPVKELVSLSRDAGALVHIDLTTSGFQIPFDVEKVHADLATLSSVDLMGPKGVGALYVRKGTRLSSLMKGGGHERGLRSGSENVPGIVGMGAAAEFVKREMSSYVPRLERIRDDLISGMMKIDGSHLNGHPENRLPNNANLRFDYIEGESMLLLLDMNGISVSSGSACTQKNLEASKTLLAMGLKHEEAHGSLQFTSDPTNTMDDVRYVIDMMPGIVTQLRDMSPLYNKQV